MTTASRWLTWSLYCLMMAGGGCQANQSAPSTPSTSSTNTPLANEMVTAHNQARSSAVPTPQPALPALTWSEEAATVAQHWASQCNFAHNPDRGPYGENIAAAAPPDSETNTQVVEDWTSESANYDYTNNACAHDKVCGHYTQVVWRDTTQVGCATVLCTTQSPFGSQFPQWRLWVCDYSPPGNYVGQRPY